MEVLHFVPILTVVIGVLSVLILWFLYKGRSMFPLNPSILRGSFNFLWLKVNFILNLSLLVLIIMGNYLLLIIKAIVKLLNSIVVLILYINYS